MHPIDPDTTDTRTDGDILGSMEQVLGDAVPQTQNRRGLMTTAAGLMASGAALSMPGIAGAAAKASESDILDVLTTFEHFGVTLLSEAVRRAPGTPSAAFAPVVLAAATTEFTHIQALQGIGGTTLTKRFWIPNAVLDGGLGLFTAIAAQEEVEISAYLVGVTSATKTRNAKNARLFAEALGTEAEHRVLARFASATIRGTAATEAPNNRGFEAFPLKSAKAALKASAAAGIGFGKESGVPGAFFEYQGDPRKNGTGSEILSTKPS